MTTILSTAVFVLALLFIILAKPRKKKYLEEPGDDIY